MSESTSPLYRSHPRIYGENRFVYPVLSRRAKGLSIGVNLNPDKICNFDCIYCQVDRRDEAETRFVEMDRLLRELEAMLDLVTGGALFEVPEFATVPDRLRRLKDIAFSGDGEPTAYGNFDQIVTRVAELKSQHDLPAVELVLITNASLLHRPAVQRALETLHARNGHVWAKLEAGTDTYYQRVARTRIPFQQIIDNIANTARWFPIVIQSLFLRIGGQPPPSTEIEQYCERRNQIVTARGASDYLQIYTVARPPAEANVSALTAEEIQSIAATVRKRTGLAIRVFAT